MDDVAALTPGELQAAFAPPVPVSPAPELSREDLISAVLLGARQCGQPTVAEVVGASEVAEGEPSPCVLAEGHLELGFEHYAAPVYRLGEG